MFKLVSEAEVIPRSLYITGVSMGLDCIGSGGSARILGGKYQGNMVALKVIDRQHKDVSAPPFPFVQNTNVEEDQSRILSGSFSVAIALAPLYPPSIGHI